MPPGHLKHVEVECYKIYTSSALTGTSSPPRAVLVTQSLDNHSVTHCHCFTVFTTLEEWIYVCIIVTGHRVIRPGPHLCCGLQVIGISELATS